jgi:hypothetical protein
LRAQPTRLNPNYELRGDITKVIEELILIKLSMAEELIDHKKLDAVLNLLQEIYEEIK